MTKTSTPKTRPQITRDAGISFWGLVNKRGGTAYVDDPLTNGSGVAGECWLWVGPVHSGKRNGYGKFSCKGSTYTAHRVSYELSVGEIPDGNVVDHLCRVKACVNPSHLEVVTNWENLQRGLLIAANRPGRVDLDGSLLCPAGHKFTRENTYMQRSGVSDTRVCKTCRARRLREWRLRKKSSRA